MFNEDEERLSDLYTTPRDRVGEKVEPSHVEIEEDDSVVLEMPNELANKKEPSLRDSKVQIPLSAEDIEKKRRKKRLILFILMMLLNTAFFGYLIYLIIQIFSSL